ncbi:hypothetical protein LTR22_025755 [Elasticomyces elasticus]|nr:hypothetical protein LTR22_025755 [Elasticomyces elasticus]
MASTGSGAWAPSMGSGTGEEVVRTLSRAFSRRTQPAAYDSDDEVPISKAEDWKLMPQIRGFKAQDEKDQLKGRRLGVTWADLTVKGVGADAAINENALSQFNIPQKIKEGRQKTPLKTIIERSHGCLKPGEMLLVLGRPGAGCTTLLKVSAPVEAHRRTAAYDACKRRLGYAEVSGDVKFGSMTANEAKQYRGQIVMNTEEELFFPTLTVGQTMDFASRMKVPFHLPSTVKSHEEMRVIMRDFLMKSMGIEHKFDTKVGNEFVRGVSGDERKRVSIIETLVTRASVLCWDNSTRGLDASTALEYTRAIRALTDVMGLSCIVTLYQAGNGIYELFDKVLILDEGKQIWYGPAHEAKPFMEDLGFAYQDGANVADYLTGVTVPTERKIKPGYEDRFPRTNIDIQSAYERSDIRPRMAIEYDYPNTEQAKRCTADFTESIDWDKHKILPSRSPLTVSFYAQVKAAILRQYQLLWGDKATFIIKQGATIVQSLIAGSLFYNAPANSSGLFIKGGAMFFSLLYNTIMAMSEVTDSFSARPVLAKHRGFALYHPAALCIAQVAADIPILFFQITVFTLPVYWMTGLKATPAAFFTYWILVFAVTMCITALFRLIGAMFKTFDDASKVSGLLVTALIMYTGYMIPRPHFHPWFGWLYWINPLAYGFEAVLSNEFHGQHIPCVNNNLVPNGPGYIGTAFSACTGVTGAAMGASSLTGTQYLHGLWYEYAHLTTMPNYNATNDLRQVVCIWVGLGAGKTSRGRQVV